MKNHQIASLATVFAAALCSGHAQTIADWNFDNTTLFPQTAVYNSPAPVTGSGTATVLGMDNSYNGTTSLADADITVTAGASTGSGSSAWRIRGGDGTYAGAGTPNGWSSEAPIGTQGAEFAASTVGFDDINLSFDLYSTTQAEANLAVLYTLDGVNWQLATILSAGSNGNSEFNSSSIDTVSGNYVQLTQTKGWDNDIAASFAGAGNDANFAVEIVNASTGADDVNISGGALNNTSGNWRLDNVAISASPVPEPGTLALAVIGGLTALFSRRRCKKS